MSDRHGSAVWISTAELWECRDTQAGVQSDRRVGSQAERLASRQVDRQEDKQIDRQTFMPCVGRQTGRQTGRETGGVMAVLHASPSLENRVVKS